MRKKFLAVLLGTLMTISVCGCSLSDLKNSKTNEDKIEIGTGENATSSDSNKDSNLWDDASVSKKIDEINKYIDNFYYFDIDKDKQEEAFYDGIMAGLDDPYSVYYTAEEYAELLEDSSGEYVGIGAVVTQGTDMNVTVVRPIPGGPAEAAGLMAGDIIVQVDDTEVLGMELTLVVDMLRGVENTTAHVKFFRPSVNDYMEVDIKRRVVENFSVYTSELDNDIGYIQVTQFYENTADEFKDAIDKFESEGKKGIIVDVRDNPGGLLLAVTDMCDYMMDGGVIVTTKYKTGKVMEEYKAKKGHKMELPMVVLTNGNSASASEIFAGAMQDTGIAKLVGTTTFGKGIVQSIIPLSDGTAIKITVAKYFTPNGNDIHKIGIKPDYEVELANGRTNAVNLAYEDDLQLQKAEEVIKDMIGK